MNKLKLAFIMLSIATIMCGVTFFCCQKLINRLYVAVAGQFLLAVWAIFLWKLFLEKVCPHIERRFKKPTVNPLEACSPPNPKGRAERERKGQMKIESEE